MGYTWTDGELITATKLNNTGGSGVLVCNSSYDQDEGTYVLDKTVQEIYDALLAGTPVYIKYQYGALSEAGGTIYLAPVIKIYNYDYTNVIRVCASRPSHIGTKGTYTYTFSPAILIYQAGGADEYPTFYANIYTPSNYVTAGGGAE